MRRRATLYTAKAIDAVLAGQAVQTAQVDATAGRTVAFPERAKAASFANISYTHDVAPILQDKCVSCHINGGIGPFAMNNYQIIKSMAPMIRETVRTRRWMPSLFRCRTRISASSTHDQSLRPRPDPDPDPLDRGRRAPRGAGRRLRCWPMPDKDRAGMAKDRPGASPDVIGSKLPAYPTCQPPASSNIRNVRVDNPFPPRTPGCAPSP